MRLPSRSDLAYIFAFTCPGGGIGRRAGFKIRFLRECGFEAHPGYQHKSSALELRINHERFTRLEGVLATGVGVFVVAVYLHLNGAV